LIGKGVLPMFVRAVVTIIFLLMLAPQYSASKATEVMDASPENTDLVDLNGSGVIIAVADTGLDLDHSCFRENQTIVGEPSISHRKVVFVNTTIDESDNPAHQQFKHGTHIAGLLVCDPIEINDEIKSLSHGSKLLFQDIVSQEGWVPPNVSLLLEEAASHGAIINSWSWGDNTIEYTDRSRMVDAWAMENPWSLVFIAPGNNGNTVMEPANAINAVSVGATNSEVNGSMWGSSSQGPDVNGRRGILIVAPGINVNSSLADGINDSMNSGIYSMGGTSVATPLAASFTSLLQQYVQDREGFTPSGPLLRGMLAMSATPINGMVPDSQQGYGRPSLDSLENDLYLHDSFAVEDWQGVVASRGSNFTSFLSNPWDGSEAVGPFLAENQSWEKYLRPTGDSDFEIVMSYNARPDYYAEDDLRLVVTTPDGNFALDDNFTSSGYSKMYTPFFSAPYSHNSTNETTVMIRLPAEDVKDYEWIKVEVFAKSVHNGSSQGTVGLDGNALGFAIAASGVVELPQNTPPQITILDIPSNGENVSHEMDIKLIVNDSEGDSGVVAIRLVNQNFTVDLTDCAKMFEATVSIECNVNFSRGLITMPINREDWRVEVVTVDNNSSIWTKEMLSTFLSDNFTIWWTSPFSEDGGREFNNPQTTESHDSRALLWGVFGVVLGVIVAASVMFRRLEKEIFDDVKPPFIEEE
jgi:hypothetical protein